MPAKAYDSKKSRRRGKERRMIRMMTKAGAILALLALPALAAPAAPADPAKGERLAKRWCASCHLVAEGQATASADAPSFAALANTPGRSAAGIADFLTLPATTHSRMPDMALSRVEIDDIAAYIATLKK